MDSYRATAVFRIDPGNPQVSLLQERFQDTLLSAGAGNIQVPEVQKTNGSLILRTTVTVESGLDNRPILRDLYRLPDLVTASLQLLTKPLYDETSLD